MTQRREFRELADPIAVREIIDGLSIAPGTENIPIASAGGRILADRLDADIDVPGFDRAAMDGYAVRAADTFGADERDPARLTYRGSVHAGETPTVSVAGGDAVEISTGAVLPPGADAVVMVERTREDGDDIVVETAVAPGEHVMAAGADIGAGRRLLGPGHELSARDIALLAATGNESVEVQARPRVGIVSTGDELVPPSATVDHSRGQIYDVNSHTIAAAVRRSGGDPHVYPHVGDDYDRMYEVLSEAAETCDVVISSGSTSASAVDVIYQVIEDSGELLVHGVAMKPGKPMIVGRMQKSAYIGLPGYPVSALMVFRQFVAGRIREAAGLDPDATNDVSARMVAEERLGEGRMRLLPVGTVREQDGSLLAYPVDKGSGATTTLSDADGVVEVPPDTAYVAPDEAVTVHLFSDAVRPPSVLAVGEDDPTFADALDSLDRPRFLPVGSREGVRRFERGIPDLLVMAGDDTPATGERVASWERKWGILIPNTQATAIRTISDLVDEDIYFANLQATALRTAFDEHLDALAEERDTTRMALTSEIEGYGVARTAHESAARQVLAGEADAGLGLVSTTANLDVDIVPIDTQSVAVYALDGRQDKTGVQSLLANLPSQT